MLGGLDRRHIEEIIRHVLLRASSPLRVKVFIPCYRVEKQILASQRRRLFLREALAKGRHADWDFTPTDELEQHCLRADKVYSQWAYQDILCYRVPEE